MPISVADLDSATKGRLAAADPETARLLEVGLGVARRYCGWHVHPVLEDDTIVLDGRGGPVLRLPTLCMLEAPAEVLERSDTDHTLVELDVTALDWSPIGRLVKRSGYHWTSRLGGIMVTYKHGFETAPGFESAVITYVARTSLSTATGGAIGQRTAVGPFQYGAATALADSSAFTPEERMSLDLYKLEAYP